MLILRSHKWPAGHKIIQEGIKFKDSSVDALLFLFHVLGACLFSFSFFLLIPLVTSWSNNNLLNISGDAFILFRCGLQRDLMKFKHAVQWHVMNIKPLHTYSWQIPCKMLFHLLFNFPSQRLRLLCLKCRGKQEPGSSICLLTLKSTSNCFAVHCTCQLLRHPSVTSFPNDISFISLLPLCLNVMASTQTQKRYNPYSLKSDISLNLCQIKCPYAPLL